MNPFSYYVGLDVHRKSISYCVLQPDGKLVREGRVASTREELAAWARTVPGPWCGGLEATICSHWIYWHLKPYAAEMKMAQPARLKAISEAKRKSDKLDARMLANLLRCDLFPACYVISPEHEKLRQQLRYRSFLVRMEVMLKNKAAGLLIGNGVLYETRRLHRKKYFRDLLADVDTVRILDRELKQLIEFGRAELERLQAMDRGIVAYLLSDPLLSERVERLRSIRGVGEVTALLWALETGDPARFPNQKHAISYCGLCAAQRESAGKQQRGPLSKQRNAALQTGLIEAAHLAIQYNPDLKRIWEAKCAKGPKNRAILEVARCLVRRLLAIDRQYAAGLAAAAA
jgi:transposase